MAWCLKNESVNCLLLGATSVEQFKENIHALQVPFISVYVFLWKDTGGQLVNMVFLADRPTVDTSSNDRDRAPAGKQAATPAHGINTSDAKSAEQQHRPGRHDVSALE